MASQKKKSGRSSTSSVSIAASHKRLSVFGLRVRFLKTVLRAEWSIPLDFLKCLANSYKFETTLIVDTSQIMRGPIADIRSRCSIGQKGLTAAIRCVRKSKKQGRRPERPLSSSFQFTSHSQRTPASRPCWTIVPIAANFPSPPSTPNRPQRCIREVGRTVALRTA